jgi:hypothetical protein
MVPILTRWSTVEWTESGRASFGVAAAVETPGEPRVSTGSREIRICSNHPFRASSEGGSDLVQTNYMLVQQQQTSHFFGIW